MTTAALGWPRIRTVGRFRSWLSVWHSLRIEAAAALTLYGLYELARGLVGADTAEAEGHADRVVALAALQSAGVARAIEYLNAHGTGTQLGKGLAGHNGCLVLGRG